MDRLNAHDVTLMFLSLGVLLTTARFLGELVERFNQPAVLGELIAGILLGPTVLGSLRPEWNEVLFPMHGARALVLDGLTTFAIALFLLVAGMDVDLSSIWRQGKTALSVSLSGVLIPFALGIAAAALAPQFVGRSPGGDPLIFALFFATALSISALPVIAKTLMDLNLYRTDLGMIVMAAAMFDDLFGWISFAIILGMMGTGATHGLDVKYTIALTILFAAGVLTGGRWLINRVLPWIQAHTRWPGGVMGFALSLAIFGAAFTEWIGVHAIFGAFLVGVAIGDSRHLREHTRTVINQFVSFVFAPLFFASIGLRVNFAEHFQLPLVLIVLAISCVGKVAGCGFAARLSGMPRRESWAIGFAMNSRGVMEIILGLLALQYHVIEEPMFIALVIMALVTSLMGGPMIQRVLHRKKPRQFIDFLKSRAFQPALLARDRIAAIRELSLTISAASGLNSEKVVDAVLAREGVTSTGLANGVAVPHARLDGLDAPLISIGFAREGIDFDAPDGRPSQIICLILTPVEDDGAQLELLADLARSFRDNMIRERILKAGNYTEFLAALKVGAAH